MNVNNTHERAFPMSPEDVGALIDTLASDNDRLWPRNEWPPMRFDHSLEAGARGGHGPIRYFVTSYEPKSSIFFEFTGPSGFNGCHGFEVERKTDRCVLRHTLTMKASGKALLSWPLVFGPLHDALIEEALDKAGRELGLEIDTRRRSPWVRFLRWLFRRLQPQNTRD